jgi:hypothetical protein
MLGVYIGKILGVVFRLYVSKICIHFIRRAPYCRWVHTEGCPIRCEQREDAVDLAGVGLAYRQDLGVIL